MCDVRVSGCQRSQWRASFLPSASVIVPSPPGILSGFGRFWTALVMGDVDSCARGVLINDRLSVWKRDKTEC